MKAGGVRALSAQRLKVVGRGGSTCLIWVRLILRLRCITTTTQPYPQLCYGAVWRPHRQVSCPCPGRVLPSEGQRHLSGTEYLDYSSGHSYICRCSPNRRQTGVCCVCVHACVVSLHFIRTCGTPYRCSTPFGAVLRFIRCCGGHILLFHFFAPHFPPACGACLHFIARRVRPSLSLVNVADIGSYQRHVLG